MRFLIRLLAASVLCVGIAVAGAPPSEQTSGILTNKNDAVILHCNQGQTAAVIYAPATTGPTTAPTTYPTTYPTSTAQPTGTPMPTSAPTTAPTTYPTSTPFTGQVTVETAQGWQSQPLAWASPASITPPGSTTYTVVLPTPYPSKLYATLAGDHWIEAVLSSPDPLGISNRAYVSCQ